MKQENHSNKKCKITEVGSMPMEWEIKQLDEVCHIETGKREKGGAIYEGIPSIGGAQIGNSGEILWENMVYIPESFYEKLRQGKVQKNDVLIVKDGATTGKTAFVRNLVTENVAINEHVFLLRAKDSIILDNYFLFVQLFSDLGQSQVNKSFHGACQGGINKRDISDFFLVLPSLPEQKKIAGVLRAVQEAKEKTEELIKAAKELKKSMMKHLFIYGPESIEEAKKVDLQNTEFGYIPVQWKLIPLKKILSEKLKNGYSGRATCENYGIRALTLSAVTINDISPKYSKIIDARNRNVSDLWVQKDDIFIERANTPEYVGLASIYEGDSSFAIYPDLLTRVRVRREKVLPKFLAYYLLTKQVRKYFKMNANITTGSMPKINHKIIEQLKLPLPNLDQQNRVIEILSAVDKKIELEENKKKALEKLFKTLLNNLMTGKIRVHNLDIEI